MVFRVFAPDVCSIVVDFGLRHGSIMMGVSGVEVLRKLLAISMSLLLPKKFNFITIQLAVYIMVGCVPIRPRSTGVWFAL